MGRAEVIDQFYCGSGLSLPLYRAIRMPGGGEVVPGWTRPFRFDEMATLNPTDLAFALDEVSRSLKVIEHNGSYFEIAVANGHVPGDNVMLHISTYSSSISSNAGNAYEFAAQAVRYPDQRHLYVASFGNGSTSSLSKQQGEQAYARQTGRFTWEKDGRTEPLPSIVNLHAALEKSGLSVTRIMGTDSAGGNYASALAVAMEEGQLSHAFFSERSGFVHLSIPGIIGGMLVKENFINARKNRALSPDPERIDERKIERAVVALSEHEDTPRREELREHKVVPKDKVASLWTSMQALRRGPTDDSNPLVADTNALLERQPTAKITFGLADRDPLYKNAERCGRAVREFLALIAVQDTPVRVVLIPEMTHAFNTHFPYLYQAIKKDALEL